MKIKELQQHYQNTLKDIYSKEEVNALFFTLIAAFYKIKRLDLAVNPDLKLTDNTALKDALKALEAETPIQYILGETEFYGLPFKVTKNTLIPRPETEALVSWVIEQVKEENTVKILDIGTGSGCIPVTLAKHLPKASVFSLDISTKALEIAEANAAQNKVNVTFLEQDVLTLLPQQFMETYGTFDIIVSNPPYVRNQEKTMMKANVLNYEPHLALFVDDKTPLLFYNAICNLALQTLKPDGSLFFEINEYLGSSMLQLLEDKNFEKIELKKDIFGKDRMIKAYNYK
jgi:release factor glutamine methyltransferase